MYTKLILFSYVLHISHCDWVSEWMAPIQDQISDTPKRKFNFNDDFKPVDDEDLKNAPPGRNPTERPLPFHNDEEYTSASLKNKLQSTIQVAEGLLETLKAQISALSTKEHILKEAIANGRSGVSTVTVTTLATVPRTYLIRDGLWTLCRGMVQYPTISQDPSSFLGQLPTTPRCIGQEIHSPQDPCVFHSLIKYETIPTTRSIEYSEDNYLCLKPNFRSIFEQYMSVPRHVINETCTHGVVKPLTDYYKECSYRIVSDYAYYPHKNAASSVLPLEYCTEKDGSCKLIVAWHVTNSSIENYEFLKENNDFQKYFMKDSGSHSNRIVS